VGKLTFDIPGSFLLEMIRWYLRTVSTSTKLPKEYEIRGVYYNEATQIWEVCLSSPEIPDEECVKEDLS